MKILTILIRILVKITKYDGHLDGQSELQFIWLESSGLSIFDQKFFSIHLMKTYFDDIILINSILKPLIL